MKCFLISIFFIHFLLFTNCLRVHQKAATEKTKPEEEISDAELDRLLKDPKYAALAGDLATPSADGVAAAALTPETSTKSSDLSTSYKDHMSKRTKSVKPKEDLDSLDLLSKSLSVDPLKDIDLMSTSSSKKEEDKIKDKKKFEMEEKFKSFDFITKQQARYLIEVLKQPVFLNMLPNEAQQIVKTVTDNFSFKFADNDKINEFIEANLVNSPNSQTYIDPDGIVGRKGILTLIDPENGASKFVWTISNAKVLTFFQSQSLLTIVKLYRNSSLILKDIGATPCFLLSSSKELKDGSILACATSTQEKEVWIQTIQSHINKN